MLQLPDNWEVGKDFDVGEHVVIYDSLLKPALMGDCKSRYGVITAYDTAYHYVTVQCGGCQFEAYCRPDRMWPCRRSEPDLLAAFGREVARCNAVFPEWLLTEYQQKGECFFTAAFAGGARCRMYAMNASRIRLSYYRFAADSSAGNYEVFAADVFDQLDTIKKCNAPLSGTRVHNMLAVQADQRKARWQARGLNVRERASRLYERLRKTAYMPLQRSAGVCTVCDVRLCEYRVEGIAGAVCSVCYAIHTAGKSFTNCFCCNTRFDVGKNHCCKAISTIPPFSGNHYTQYRIDRGQAVYRIGRNAPGIPVFYNYVCPACAGSSRTLREHGIRRRNFAQYGAEGSGLLVQGTGTRRKGVMNYSCNVIEHLRPSRQCGEIALVLDKSRAFAVGRLDEASIYYGVELEIETRVSWGKIAKQFPAVDALRGKPPLIAKEDGSLHDLYGMELVTLPATFEAQVELWKALESREIKGKLRSYNDTDDRCGLHIHVSRAPLTDCALQVIDYLVGHVNNQKVTEYFARRCKSMYCKHHKKTTADLGEAATDDHNEHYQAVSFSRHFPTLEFRIYKGTTAYSGVLLCLEHCQSVVEFSRAVSAERKHIPFASEQTLPDAGVYLSWCKKQFAAGKWARLAKYVAAMPDDLSALPWRKQDEYLPKSAVQVLPSREDI